MQRLKTNLADQNGKIIAKSESVLKKLLLLIWVDEQEKYWIKRAMTEWERYTCVRFRPAVSTDRNVVRFQNGYG